MSHRLSLADILLKAQVVAPRPLHQLQQRIGADRDLGDALVEAGLLDEDTLLMVIGNALNLATVLLDQVEADPKALARLPRHLCETYLTLPLKKELNRAGQPILRVAMVNPTRIDALRALTRAARMRIRPLLASPSAIRAAIRKYYGGDTLESHDTEAAPSPSPAGAGLPPLPQIPSRVPEAEPVRVRLDAPPTPPSVIEPPPPELAAPLGFSMSPAPDELLDALTRKLTASPEAASTVLLILLEHLAKEDLLPSATLQAMLDAC